MKRLSTIIIIIKMGRRAGIWWRRRSVKKEKV
jgi:hypothetical protein